MQAEIAQVLNGKTPAHGEYLRFIALPIELQKEYEELINQMVDREECCDFQRSLKMEFRRQIAQRYQSLKKRLLDVGMDETDSILVRLQATHQKFHQYLLWGDMVALQMENFHFILGEDGIDGVAKEAGPSCSSSSKKRNNCGNE